MDVREKLIDLIVGAKRTDPETGSFTEYLADYLYQHIEEIREERCYNCRNFKDMKCDYCGTADYIYMIEDMPAADVAPVQHAKWEIVVGSNGKEYMVCTGCRKQQDLTGVFSYCPNCGAKMDEKEE